MEAEATANQPSVLCYRDLALHALSPREATLITQSQASTNAETRQMWALHILGRLYGASDTPPLLYTAWWGPSPLRKQEVSERVGSPQSDVVLYSVHPIAPFHITATADSMVHTLPMESGLYPFQIADVFSKDDVPRVKAINLLDAYSASNTTSQQGDKIRNFPLEGFRDFFTELRIERRVVFGGAVWSLKEIPPRDGHSSHVIGVEVWRNRSWNVRHKGKYSPVLFRKTDEAIEQMVSNKDMFSVRPEDRQRLLYEIFRVLPLWETAGGSEGVLSPLMSDSQAVPPLVLPAEDLFVSNVYYSMLDRVHNRKEEDPYGIKKAYNPYGFNKNNPYRYLYGSPGQVIDGASIALAKGEFEAGAMGGQEQTINNYQAALKTLTQFDFQQ